MSLPFQFKNAIKINFKATSKKLADINSSNDFVVASAYPTIDKLRITITKSNRCFTFRMGPFNIVPNMFKYQNIAYGLGKPFRLLNSNNWNIYNGVSSHTFSPGKKNENEGYITELNSNFNERNNNYFRLLIPQNGGMYNRPRSFIKATAMNINERYSYGLVSISVGSKNYRLYDHSSENGNYLVIDSLEKQSFKQFEQVATAIRFSFALISGFLERNESYVLVSNSSKFDSISGFAYKKELDTIDSGKHIICPWILQEFLNLNKKIGFLPVDVFSKLVSITLKNKSVTRAVQILTQSNKLPLEICTAAYSVCLETIKNVVIDLNRDKVNPISSKGDAKRIIKSLKDTVNSFDSCYYNNKNVILSKIDNINQLSNIDSILHSFKLLGIDLTDNDTFCIKRRNDFLHGKIPFENELDQSKKTTELKLIAYKLHFLTCCLLLKMAGFNGYLINFTTFLKLRLNYGQINEPAFRLI